jgi:hypothetical protein
MLHNREGHSKEICFLECALADELGEDLSGDADHRDGVHVGIGDAGDEIGGAGAGGGHTYADFAIHAGPSLGCENAALFVAGEDDADVAPAGERLV